ncbi:MAG TPA: SMI1/KNR4 family protein [Lacipirellulaceae bacterium]|nr:SMI1/KNR4 family protein [Lacipirellulaceae bacterium]
MAVTFTYRVEDGVNFKQRAVTDADVLAAEKHLGVTFPREFRAFLIAHDAPTPEPAWFPTVDSQWCGPIASFISTWQPTGRGGIGRSPCIEHLTEAHRDMEKLHHQYIVIAQMLTHPNTLLLSTGPDDFGAVYAWRPLDKKFQQAQLLSVANNFDAFLQLLADPPRDVLKRFELVRSGQVSSQRAPADNYAGPEARRWLRASRNVAALAVNHFGGTENAREFVDELYRLGATKVLVPETSIQKDDGGPYADALVVELPADAALCAAVCLRCEKELDVREPLDPNDPNPVYLWWD